MEINVILSAIQSAFATSVQQAVAAATAPLVERIEKLETNCTAYEILHKNQHDALVALRDRITALENNPAIGVDTTLEKRVAVLEQSSSLDKMRLDDMAEKIAALETKLTEANLFTQNTNVTIPIDEAKMVEALNSQEWFWEKLTRKAGEVAEAAAEAAMDDHLGTYDHDEYDNHINDDDKHFDGDIEDAVRDALNGTSVTLSF